MNKNLKSERHHWVPKCYLKNFTFDEDSKLIFLYRRKAPILKSNIENISVKRNLYTFKSKITGGKTNIIEKVFGVIEAKACPIINKILEKKDLSLNKKEKIILTEFNAFLATRSVPFNNWQRNTTIELQKFLLVEQAKNKIFFKKHLEKIGIKIKNDKQFEDLRNSILKLDEKSAIKLTGGNEYFFKQAVDLTQELTPLLFSKVWHLLITTGSRVFITSDNPIIIQRARHSPPLQDSGFYYGAVLLTLSPSVCLLMRNNPLKEKIIFVNRQQVDLINKSIMFQSNKFIYSNIQSQDIKNLYDNTPEGYGRVIMKKIRNTPYFFGDAPEPDLETIY